MQLFPPPKKQKMQTMLGAHFDRMLTGAENERAQTLLTFAYIMNGWSQNGLQKSHFWAFCQALRADFQVLPPYFLNKYRRVLFQEIKHAAETKGAKPDQTLFRT